MIEILIGACIGCSAFVGLMFLNRHVARRIREETTNDVLNALGEVLVDAGDTFTELCPTCGHCGEKGGPCKNPDYQNIIYFGECTRYEEKRF